MDRFGLRVAEGDAVACLSVAGGASPCDARFAD